MDLLGPVTRVKKMEKKWGEWERNGSMAAAPKTKTSAPIGPQLALIESWPEPAPPLEPIAGADAGPPHVRV